MAIIQLLLLLILSTSSFAKNLGQISGNVEFKNSKGEKTSSHAVIFITGYTSSAPNNTLKIIQKDKKFEPSILPIVKGQKVDFINHDQISHNVFSVSNSREFDIGQKNYKESKIVDFNKTGIIDVFCNIHYEMTATILVLPNRSFAITDKDGKYTIPDIPVGNYTVYIWTRGGAPKSRKLSLKADATEVLNWQITLSKKIKQHLNKFGKEYDTSGTNY